MSAYIELVAFDINPPKEWNKTEFGKTYDQMMDNDIDNWDDITVDFIFLGGYAVEMELPKPDNKDFFLKEDISWDNKEPQLLCGYHIYASTEAMKAMLINEKMLEQIIRQSDISSSNELEKFIKKYPDKLLAISRT